MSTLRRKELKEPGLQRPALGASGTLGLKQRRDPETYFFILSAQALSTHSARPLGRLRDQAEFLLKEFTLFYYITLFGETPIRRLFSDINKCSEEDNQNEGYLNWVVGEDLSEK